MKSNTILQTDEFVCVLNDLADKIIQNHNTCDKVMLIGIQRRGVNIAQRLHDILEKRTLKCLPMGTLDINLYRDDWTSLDVKAHIGQSNILHEVDGMTIILVDDVLYTGRTIRAALDALLDYGRPQKVELLVLVDRGHRELPIEGNYVGCQVSTKVDEHVNVLVLEQDGKDEVIVMTL